MQQHQANWHDFTQQQQMKGPPTMQAAQIKATPPPPTTRDPEVRQAKEDALRQERMRMGRRSTILAGAGDAGSGAGTGASQSGSGVGRLTLGG